MRLTNIPAFARGDADWEMFCRGGARDEGPAWLDDAAAGGRGAAATASKLQEWLREPDEDAPVELEPAGEGDAGGAARAGGPRIGAAITAASAPRVRHFRAKVVGVGYANADGSSRIEAVRELKPRELVRLAHRPDNPVDANAVAVLRRRADGRQLGYLRAAVAKEVVAAARAAGTRYLAVVGDVSGGGDPFGDAGGQAGAVLLVLVLEGGATRAMARAYLLDLLNRGAA